MRRIPEPQEWCFEFSSVAVTGTNGKTSCTLWAGAALAHLSSPVAQITSLGAFLDREPFEVSRSYAGLTRAMRAAYDRGGRCAVVEFASWSLAQGFAAAWPCRIAVFTNLTHEHLDIHGSLEGYLASKAQLFVSLPAGGVAVLNAADEASAILGEVVPSGVRSVYYGCRTSANADARIDFEITSVNWSSQGTDVGLLARDGSHETNVNFRISGIGPMFAENATGAIAAAVSAGVPLMAAIQAVASTPPPPGRFEIVHECPTIVLDFAHTPDALQRSLATCRRLSAGRTLVVFGAGGDKDKSKRPLLGRAAAAADVVYLTSDNPRSEDPLHVIAHIREGLGAHDDVQVEPDRATAILAAVRDAGEADIVLVAGRGPETHQCTSRGWVPLSDAVVIATALRSRNG